MRLTRVFPSSVQWMKTRAAAIEAVGRSSATAATAAAAVASAKKRSFFFLFFAYSLWPENDRHHSRLTTIVSLSLSLARSLACGGLAKVPTHTSKHAWNSLHPDTGSINVSGSELFLIIDIIHTKQTSQTLGLYEATKRPSCGTF